jgi:hypothetical protein
MRDVVFDEVVFETDGFGFVADHCALRVYNGNLVAFPDGGGGVGDMDTLNFAEELADVNGLAGGVRCRVLLGFASRLSDARLLSAAIANGAGAKCKSVARAWLALFGVIAPFCMCIA